MHTARTLCPRGMCTFSLLCSCAAVGTGHELAFFYCLGILDACEDNTCNHAFDALDPMLIGAFDSVEIYASKTILNNWHTLLRACCGSAVVCHSGSRVLPPPRALSTQAPPCADATRAPRTHRRTREILGPRACAHG